VTLFALIMGMVFEGAKVRLLGGKFKDWELRPRGGSRFPDSGQFFQI